MAARPGLYDAELSARGLYDAALSGPGSFDPDFIQTAAAASGTTVTPGVGALALVGYAPTIAVTLNVNLTPSVGALTLVGLAPTIQTPVVVLPATGALTLVGLAPTVQTPVILTPGVGALTLSGLAPTVQTPRTVTPDVGALTLVGLAPTVSVSVGANINVTPDVGVLTLTGLAPTVQTPRNLTPDVGALVLAGLAPTVTTTANVTVTLDTGGGDRAKYGSWLSGSGRRKHHITAPQPVYRWPVGMADPYPKAKPPTKRRKALDVVVAAVKAAEVVPPMPAAGYRKVDDSRARRDAFRRGTKLYSLLDTLDTQLAGIEAQRAEQVRLHAFAAQRELTAKRNALAAAQQRMQQAAYAAWVRVEEQRLAAEARQRADDTEVQEIIAILNAITD